MANGEIAHHVQFQLLSQCFQKSSAAITWKCVCRWERVKSKSIIQCMFMLVLLYPHDCTITYKCHVILWDIVLQVQHVANLIKLPVVSKIYFQLKSFILKCLKCLWLEPRTCCMVFSPCATNYPLLTSNFILFINSFNSGFTLSHIQQMSSMQFWKQLGKKNEKTS